MNVLSLFDGMSCGRQALERIGIKVDNYYASEIDKYAITVTMANYPNTKQLGSVVDVKGSDLPKIDLLLGGSPCQSFSFAGKRKGMSTKCETEILTLEHYLELKEEGYEFEGQSYLFWEYMRLLNEVKPKYFLLENVMMGKKWQSILTKAIGVEPIVINSSLVSAQNRKRLYWTNIGLESNGLFGDLKSIIEQPIDKGILLKDILEDEVDEKYFLSEKIIEGFKKHKERHDDKGTGFGFKVKESNDKGNSLRANAAICPTDNMVMAGQLGFKKDFKESEKAQTLLQRDYKGMSNHGINVVIVHNTMPRSSKTGKGGTGHLTRDDGKTYCLDTKQSNAVEIVLTSKDKRLKQTIINNELELDKVKALDVYNQSIHDIYPTLKDPIHNDRALFDGNRIRRLTPIECERLQTVKDNYTNHVSNSQRYKMLGNGWTVSVISHILSYMNGKS